MPPAKSSEQPTENVGRVVVMRKDRAIKSAIQTVWHVSTVKDCRLVVFCDGSADGLGTDGAYAVSVNKYLPGTKEHGQRIGCAWSMDASRGATMCEATAVFEGINKAGEAICGIWESGVLGPADRAEDITVEIFSDWLGPLRSLKEGKADREKTAKYGSNGVSEADT